jgi:uncharacterized membrane protein SpoIIM required for sporulation
MTALVNTNRRKRMWRCLKRGIFASFLTWCATLAHGTLAITCFIIAAIMSLILLAMEAYD